MYEYYFSDLKRIFEYDTETLSKTEVDTVLSVDREEQEATESDITSIEDEDFTEEREKEKNIEMSPTLPQDWIQIFLSDQKIAPNQLPTNSWGPAPIWVASGQNPYRPWTNLGLKSIYGYNILNSMQEISTN